MEVQWDSSCYCQFSTGCHINFETNPAFGTSPKNTYPGHDKGGVIEETWSIEELVQSSNMFKKKTVLQEEKIITVLLIFIHAILTKKDLNWGGRMSILNSCADYPKHVSHVSIHTEFPT